MKARVAKRKVYKDPTAVATGQFTWARFLLFTYKGVNLVMTVQGEDVLVFSGHNLFASGSTSEEFDIPDEWAEHAYNLVQARDGLENIKIRLLDALMG